MNLLIVYTHPNHQSLNAAFLQQVMKGSEENSLIHNIEVLDLYAEKFDPVLIFHENKRRRDMYKEPLFDKYRKQLEWANQIVFIYPIWWGRPPAMLLGYFDQVLAAGFAYRNTGGLLSEGLLKDKKVVCISTMKGPTFYPLFFHNNAHKALMKKAVFHFIGIKKVKFFEFGNMEKRNGKQTKQLNKIYQYFKQLS